MNITKRTGFALGILALLFTATQGLAAQTKDFNLLHVSYDISREVFKAINDGFSTAWTKAHPGSTVKIDQSHAGSSKQAQAVADGLNADIVSMNQFIDIDYIADKSKGTLVPADWQKLLPNNASPFSSTMTFVVRKGNPKGIKDWNDLVKSGVEIVVPNLKTTGNGRYTYLTAWAYALQANKGDSTKARAFLKDFIKNVPVMAPGGRDATTIFVEREQGDVLVTFEAEANQIVRNFAKNEYEQIVPSYGLDAKVYVATVVKNAKEKGNTEVAKAYWDYVYSPEGQEIAAKNFFRVNDAKLQEKYRNILPKLNLVSIESVFGSWDKANEGHFVNGGSFDQLFKELGRN